MSELELMRKSGYTDPELAEILSKSGLVSGLDETTDIPSLRRALKERKQALTAAAGPCSSSTKETDHTIKTRDGDSIVVRVYAGAKSSGGPVIVMLHGGGWILGDLDNEALLCRKWAEDIGGIAVNAEYRLAPEHKFPVALYDSYDAVLWTAANPAVHGGDLAKGFIVAGISAGGNMAAAIMHLARDDDMKPPLTGVYLSIPSVLDPQAVPEKWKDQYKSRVENGEQIVLNTKSINYFRSQYQDDPHSPIMSPLLFPSHKDLPPTYFQVAGLDPLRDEALLFEEILREECGVPTKLDLYPGLPHGFWSWWPKANFSQKQLKDSMAGFRWLLGKH